MFLERTENDADSLYGVEAFQPAPVEQVIAEMRKGVGGPLSLGDMADIAHLSPYHFARTFRRVTGVPPGEFLSALRLEEAKRLLLTTDLSVSEICFETGYSSLGTFTTRFKRLVGMSPGRLRRLPEEAAPVLDLLTAADPFPSPSYVAGMHGQITAPDTDEALIFVGLFPGAIPQRRPVAGTILTSPGAYMLPPVPDGCYQLMAAALPRCVDPLAYLLPDNALRVGRSPSPVLVRTGTTSGPTDVTLRPPRNTDPPVLVALLVLLLERVSENTRAR
ncbi:MAG: helix-turn-helix transcriptional regulator [Rubrobacteraceae bacterium]